MGNNIFIDTSGFYALLVKRDNMHEKAKNILQDAVEHKIIFTTTDYILDETVTLLHSRGLSFIIKDLFDVVFNSRACNIEWMDQERFTDTRLFFLKHIDQLWSFTDCFSFLVMKELKQERVLTKDNHFQEIGFTALLV
jgi:predicted nucleic acid-binding protein